MAERKKAEAPLGGVWVVMGDDPEMVRLELEGLRQRAALANFPPRSFVVGSDIDVLRQVQDEFASGSLFADSRFVEVLLPAAPKVAEQKVLKELPDIVGETDLLLLAVPAAKKSAAPAWAKGCREVIWAAQPTTYRYEGWLKSVAQSRQLQPDREVLNHWKEFYRGNPLAARMEMDRLRLAGVSGRCGMDQVREYGADRDEHLLIGDLIRGCLHGDARLVERVLLSMEEEAGSHHMLVLYTLARCVYQLGGMTHKIRRGMPMATALEESNIWSSQHDQWRSALRRRPNPDYWYGLASRLTWIDGCVRGRHLGIPDLEVRNLALAFCSLAPARRPMLKVVD